MRIHFKGQPIQVCGCGDCERALEAAEIIASNLFRKTGAKEDYCAGFNVAIADHLYMIAGMILTEELMKIAQDNGVAEDEARETIANKLRDTTANNMAALFDNQVANKRIADLVASLAGSDVDRASIEAGPSLSALMSVGVAVVEEVSLRDAVPPSIDAVLDALRKMGKLN